MPFYAVARGKNAGIYNTWAECEAQVKGFKGARYKKFATQKDAEDFISAEKACASKIEAVLPPKDVTVPSVPVFKSRVQKQQINIPTKTITKTDRSWPKDADFDDDLADEDLIAALEVAEKGTKRKCNNDGQPSTSASRSNKILKPMNDDKPSASSLVSNLPKHKSKIWHAVKKVMIGGLEFQVDKEDYVLVYTDGSCFKNGRRGAAAGYGVYFGDNHALNTAAPVVGRATNNVGEIQAAICAIELAIQVGIQKLCISTDSQFLINSITQWIYAWKQMDWKTKDGEPVKNRVDFKKLDALLNADDMYVKWNYVRAHRGIKGNEEADRLARLGSDMHKAKHLKKSKLNRKHFYDDASDDDSDGDNNLRRFI